LRRRSTPVKAATPLLSPQMYMVKPAVAGSAGMARLTFRLQLTAYYMMFKNSIRYFHATSCGIDMTMDRLINALVNMVVHEYVDFSRSDRLISQVLDGIKEFIRRGQTHSR
jgi:hypothetical protein